MHDAVGGRGGLLVDHHDRRFGLVPSHDVSQHSLHLKVRIITYSYV